MFILRKTISIAHIRKGLVARLPGKHEFAPFIFSSLRKPGLPNDLYIAISGFDLPGRPAISNNDEQSTDDRQILQRVHQGLGIFRREIIDCRGDKEDQKNGKEPCAEIEGNHQSRDDLQHSNSDGEYLRSGHSRHRFQLRGVGNNKGRNDGGNKISGWLNAKEFGRPRIDERQGEQNSSQSNQRWHGGPRSILRMWGYKAESTAIMGG